MDEKHWADSGPFPAVSSLLGLRPSLLPEPRHKVPIALL